MTRWFAETTLDIRDLDHAQMNRLNDIATWHEGGVGTDENKNLIIQFKVDAEAADGAAIRAAFLARAMAVSALPGSAPEIITHTVTRTNTRCFSDPTPYTPDPRALES